MKKKMCEQMDRNNFQSVAVAVSGSSSSSASLTFSLMLTESAHYCSKQQFGTGVYTSDHRRTYCQDIIFLHFTASAAQCAVFHL